MPKIDTTALVRRAVEAIWNQGDLAVADMLSSPATISTTPA